MKRSHTLKLPAIERRRWSAQLVLILLLATLLLPITANAAKTYRAERYDVDLIIQPDGSLIVTETVVFRFEGGPFTYVFRDLAFTELDEIDRLQAGMDGQTLSLGTGPGQVEIQSGRPLKVTWHLPPTSDATHTFTLVYRVQGAIRRLADADALFWRAIPEEHDYEITASTVTLRYPETTSLLGRPMVRGAAAQVEWGGGRAVVTAGNIGRNRDLIVEARFPPGSLIGAPPRWQRIQIERQEQVRQALPAGLLAGLLTVVAGGGWLAWSWRRYPRPAVPASARLMTHTAPPSDLPPALGVKLAGGTMPALGALFDLARRGVLRIEEVPGRWGRKFILHRQPDAGPLRPHEQGLLEAMFRTKAGLEESTGLTEAGRRLGNRLKQFNKPLEAELMAAGLLDEARHKHRQRLLAVTLIGTVLGVLLFIIGVILAGAVTENRAWSGLPLAVVTAGLGVGLFLFGLVGVILASTFPTLTAAGEEAAAAWRSFGRYLRDVARGRQALLRDEQFEAYLPIAAGFGLAERWARRYTQQSGVPIPAWFTALQPDETGAAFVAAMSASHSSVGSGSSGAAGGASGGGASGAG